MAALLLAYLLLHPIQADEQSSQPANHQAGRHLHPWNTTGVALGLAALAIGDGLHAMAPPGQAFVFLKSFANLAGAVGFALSWVALCGSSDRCKVRTALAVICLMTALGTWALAFPSQLPLMVDNVDFTPLAIGVNALAGLFYLVAAGRFGLDFAHTGDRDRLAYLATALLFSLGSFFFSESMLWDSHWWYWHFLRLTAYLIVLWLVIKTYLEAERTLIENAYKYRVVADNTHDWEYWTDRSGAFLYSSPSCADVTGRESDEFFQQPHLLEEIIHPDDRPAWAAHKKTLYEANRQGELEFRILLPGGGERWIGHVCRPVLDDAGRLAGRRGSNRDISRSKKAEEDIIHAKEAAERANRSKSEFLATMSHEIRTPLNGVQGMLQLIKAAELGPELAEYVDIAMESSQNLLTVINDILDLSKVEAGKITIDRDGFDLDALLRSIKATFTQQAASKGLTLDLDIAPGVPAAVIGDAIRLRQVLFNLVGNAIKFTEQGAVRLDVRVLDQIDARHLRLGFAITDTGIGIPADRIGELFSPFTQVDSSSTRRFKGTGLGLAIVKRLVNLMDGQISIESAPGQGTTVQFDIALGVAADADSITTDTAPARRPVAPGPTTALRILVVDDEPINAKVVTMMLGKMGYTASSAVNGRQALDALSEQPFDLVFMDISMPDMDGVEATRQIRANVAGNLDPSTPIIALTAHAMKGDRERFLAAGMDDYLPKPVEAKALREVMQRVLAQRN
ncbi:response regulator [Thiorhodovibrio frisius]|nr:response regulator [Thiorhodovibrio frisius]